MSCTTCGSPLNPGMSFCGRCGRPVAAPAPATTPATAPATPPSAPAGRGPSRLVAALLGFGAAALAGVLAAALLVLTGVVSIGSGVSSGSQRFEGSGFATPDAAVEAYTAAMQKSDVDAMARTFAIESYSEHFDLRAYIERLGAYFPFNDQALPPGPVNTSLNTRARLNTVTQQIKWQYWTLSQPDIDPATTASAKDAGGADQLYGTLQSAFDGTAFSGVHSASIVDAATAFPAMAGKYDSDQFREYVEKTRTYLGADEVTQRVSRLETDSGSYFLVFELVRYQNTWRVETFSGSLAALVGIDNYSGGLVKA